MSRRAFVACRMPGGIVDLLEVIEIDKQERVGLFLPGGHRRHTLQARMELPIVHQVHESIVRRLVDAMPGSAPDSPNAAPARW